MHWIAPSEKDKATDTLEKRLWDDDGQFRANSGLSAAQYSQPVPGLIFRRCRMNLVVHGLEGDIRHGGQMNSCYDDPHDATGRFDFVLANPSFNVTRHLCMSLSS